MFVKKKRKKRKRLQQAPISRQPVNDFGLPLDGSQTLPFCMFTVDLFCTNHQFDTFLAAFRLQELSRGTEKPFEDKFLLPVFPLKEPGLKQYNCIVTDGIIKDHNMFFQ